MKQGEAVRQAFASVVGSWEGKCIPTAEQRAKVHTLLTEGFVRGEIELRREYDEKELKRYVTGLISNWLRKDKFLNGGVQYKPSEMKDAQVRAMRQLLQAVSNPAEKARVQECIAKRLTELKVEKQQKHIDINSLPKELQEIVFASIAPPPAAAAVAAAVATDAEMITQA